jgi:hypothetical protein
MGDNMAFDVVIGLIFIYLLYSLYATVMMEIFSSLFGLRARNLRYATQRMLMDDVPPKNYVSNLAVQLVASFCQIFGIRPPGMKNPQLYKDFWAQPSIKSLSGGGLSNTPSYISGDNFAKALIDALKTKNIDLGMLSAIEEGIEQLDKGDTRNQLYSLLTDANSDLVKFNLLVANWYEETMERATGWFKRTTQLFLFLIGMNLAFSFNINSIDIIHKLSINEAATAQLVKMATDFSGQQRTTGAQAGAVPGNTATDSSDVKALKESLEKNIRDSQNIISSGWYISDRIRFYKPKKVLPKDQKLLRVIITNTKRHDSTSRLILVHDSIDPAILAKTLSGLKQFLEGDFIPVNPNCYKYYYILDNLLGYILTILALSLGAPFWFDLLNKVIKLRSSIPAVSGQMVPLENKKNVNATLRRAG